MENIDEMFSDGTEDIDSLFEEEPLPTIRSNPTLDRLNAGYATIMSGEEEPFDVKYRTITGEYQTIGYSPTVDDIEMQAAESQFVSDRDRLIDIVADPEIDDETKRNAAMAVYDMNARNYSFREMYASDILMKQPDVPESQAEEEVVYRLADIIDEVNLVNTEKQKLLNAEIAKADLSVMSMIGDFASLLVPFYEQQIVNQIDFEDESWPFLLLGESRDNLANAINRLPPEQQMLMARKVVDIINSESSIVMDNPNELARIANLTAALDNNSYSDGEKFVDNLTGVLDMFILYKPVKGALTTLSSLVNQSSRKFIRSRTSPIAPTQQAKTFNNDEAKKLDQEINKDPSDETAQALSGTTKADHNVDVITPQVVREDGTVDPNIIDPTLKRVMGRDGAIYWTDEAKGDAVVRFSNKFIEASDANIRANMSTLQANDKGVSVVATYGPPKNGWASADDALDTMAFNLRDFGVTTDDLTILARQVDGTYKPATKKELAAMDEVRYEMRKSKGKQPRNVRVAIQPPSDYLVQLKYDYNFNPMDVFDPQSMETVGNVFDRSKFFMFGSQFGSLSRHTLDPMSFLDPSVTKPMSAAVDRTSAAEKALLDLADREFGKPFKKMSNAKQDLVYDILKQQNKERRFMSTQELKAAGLDDAEADVIRGFRKVQDNLYFLENMDLAKTLRNQNYKVLTDNQGTRLFGKPVNNLEELTPSTTRLYDLDMNQHIDFSSLSVKQLKEEGYTVVKLRRPEKMDDVVDGQPSSRMVTHVLTKDSPKGSYLRGIRDDEKILNYIDGYYKVRYTAPLYVTKKIVDESGKVLYTKAIGTASNTKEAQRMLAAFESKHADADGPKVWNNQGVEESIYRVRDDLKADDVSQLDAEMDLAMAGGRSSQKVRGDRLVDANDEITSHASHIEGPMDSLVNSSRGLAHRTTMRPVIDALKKRFMDKYKTELNANERGMVEFPTSVTQIGRAGEENSDLAKDMRANWEYINYLENGYRNTIDDGVKAGLNVLAKIVGGKFPKGEEALYWLKDNAPPTQLARNAAFTLYLALNPIRQVIVQGHQSIQLLAIEPAYVMKSLARDMSVITAMRLDPNPQRAKKLAAKLSGMSEEAVDRLFKDYMDSGIPSSIDKQSLISGSLTEMTEYSKYTKGRGVVGTVGRGASKVVRGARKIGFDLGEEINMATAWLTMRNRKAREVGRFDLTNAELDEVSANARNFTYNMNAAGDMPYNSNILNVPMQFLQVPHKAIMQVTTNRILTGTEKARVAAFSMAVYGPFGYQLSQWIGDDKMSELPEFARDSVERGFETAALNAIFNSLGEDDFDIDFKNLAPYDAGLLNLTTALMTTNPATYFTDSPSGQLVGDRGRIKQLARSVSKLFGDFGEEEQSSVEDMKRVTKDFLSLASGFSNVSKAVYAFEHKKLINTRGDVTDQDVSALETMFIAAGFPTSASTYSFKMVEKKAKRNQEIKDEAKMVYTYLQENVFSKGYDTSTQDYGLRVMQEYFRLADDEETKNLMAEEINRLVIRDMKQGNVEVLYWFMKDAGVMTHEETLQAIRTNPDLDDDLKEKLIDATKYLNNYNEEEN